MLLLRPTRSELAALGAALVPFVLYVGGSYSQTANGRVVSAYGYNTAGIVFGVAAVVLAIHAFLKLHIEATGQPRAPHVAGIAAIAVLGLYQIARGAGLLV